MLQETVVTGNTAAQRLLRVRDVADLLYLHPNTVRQWSNRGLLRVYRLGTRGDRRFLREDVLRLIQAMQQG